MIQIEDNDTHIMVAQKLIHGTKAVGTTLAMRFAEALNLEPVPGEKFEVDMFSDAEIREIADYLLTYCKYHEEDEE